MVFDDEDISNLNNIRPELPADKAIKNISGAKEFSVDPDLFEGGEEVYTLAQNDAKYPSRTHPAYAKAMKASTQHPAAMREDGWSFNKLANIVKNTKDAMSGKDLRREANELWLERMENGGKLDLEKRARLLEIQQEMAGYPELSIGDSIIPEIVSSTIDFGKGILDQSGILLGGIGAGAAGGGLLGLAAGPGGIIPGAIMGAKAAAPYAGLAATFRDAYRMAKGDIYGELYQSDVNQKLGLTQTENERKYLAETGGMFIAILNTGAFGKIVTKDPWVKKLLNGKSLTKTLRSVDGAPLGKLIRSLAGSGFTEGVTEGFQEFIQIAQKEVFETYDGTETSFINGMKNFGAKWKDYKDQNGNKKSGYGTQIGKSALIGGVAGPTMEIGAKAIGGTVRAIKGSPKEVDANVNPPKPPPATDIASDVPMTAKVKQTILVKDIFEQGAKAIKNTKVNNLMPDEAKQIKQDIMESNGLPYVFVDKEGLNLWADTEEKANAVKEILTSDQAMAVEANAPLKIDSASVLALEEKFPGFSEIIKKDPEAPTFKQYVELTKEQEAKRAELEKKATTEPLKDMPVEERTTDSDIFGEDDYLSQPTFTEEIEGVVSAAEVLKINEAQINARTQVSETIKSDIEKEYTRLIDLETEAATIAEREQQITAIEDDKDIALVEDFLNNRLFSDPGMLSDAQQKRLAKKKPAYAIDPTTLSKALRDKYENDPVLKKRGVFAMDGVPVWHVTENYGVSEEKLLSTLASTPTRKQAVDNAVNARAADLKLEAEINNPLDKSKIAEAYHNMTKNHVKEMKILLNKSWSATKKGIKRIVLPLPKISDIDARASSHVKNTKIRDLNVNQWKVGERRSQKKAVDAVLKNELEEAFTQKQNAALNSQLAKHTHLAIGKINRTMKWIARLSTPRNKEIIAEAGPIYINAMNSIFELYNFDSRDSSKMDGYRKYAEQMLADGKGDFRIPDEVLSWLTGAKSYRELSVDQFNYIADKLKEIMHQARLKTTLKTGPTAREESIGNIADEAEARALAHPAYDPKRLNEPINKDLFKYTQGTLAGLRSSTKNLQFIMQEADQGKLGEFFSIQIWHRLNGTGPFAGSKTGLSYEAQLAGEMRERWLKHIKNTIGSDFKNYGITRVFVKEFENNVNLGSGDLTKNDLLVLFAHMGNEENRARVRNFDIDPEYVFNTLTKYLNEKEMDFVQQAIWDEHKRNEQAIVDLHLRTTGKLIELTKPKAFTVKFADGTTKEYRGGYVPIKYNYEAESEVLAAELQSIMNYADPTKERVHVPSPAFEGIVSSPHTKERTGAKWMLDLEFDTIARGFDEVFHDLAMREPVRDTMALLGDPTFRDSLIGIVGKEKYKVAIDSVAEQTNSATAIANKLYSAQHKLVSKGINGAKNAQAIAHISYNYSSVVMSLLNLPEAMNKMGIKSGGKYILKSVFKLYNPLVSRKLREEAFERNIAMDPRLKSFRTGVDEFTNKSIANDVPKKRMYRGPGVKVWHLGRRFQEMSAHFSLNGILGSLDSIAKNVYGDAAYNQFMNGEAKGWDSETIMAMSLEDRDKAAQAYAAQLLDSVTMGGRTLDKAPVQKQQFTSIFTSYWNEPRNKINNVAQDAMTIRNAAKRMRKNIKNGDIDAASADFMDMVDTGFRRIFAETATLLIIGFVTGKLAEELFDEKDWAEDPFTKFFTMYGNSMVTNNVPIIRDVAYAVKNNKDGLSVPVLDAGIAVGATVANVGPKYLQALIAELSVIDAAQKLSDKELRQLLTTISLASGGLPVNAPLKYKDIIKSQKARGETTIVDNVGGLLGAAVSELTRFITNNDKRKGETFEERMKRLELQADGKVDTLQEVVDQAKEIKERLQPTKKSAPQEWLDVIKRLESNGKWNAKPPFKKDKNGNYIYNKFGERERASSAFGLYQFIKRTWDYIKDSAPHLGLTDKGRTSPKTEQQEKAARWYLDHIVDKLKEVNAPVDLKHVYAMWIKGHNSAEEVKRIFKGEKVNFSFEEAEANPDLMSDSTTFKNSILKKLKDVEEAD